ncbi:MAG: sigma-70 family RNA polymerase sigma factor [Gammaproteobacteria bacterium]|nr:sigma-70 family RNA polymerase sigma factor [Gammaproteobacteria bacterium]MDH4312209.1 sigma-70 family RNA polymerase sigma factor [Gammaproteobacteria bacterium]
MARRILSGDQVAFRSLFDRFFPRLYRFVLARLDGDHDAARDVVQQTFCRGIERLDSYRGEAALYTWFYQVCRNTLLDYGRHTRRELRVIVRLEDLPDVRAVLETLAAPLSEQPETGVWRSEVSRLVQATVDALPERYGEILEWKYVDGQSVRHIAGRLGVSDKAAESLLTRAREAFREAITAMAGSPDALEPPGRT